MLGILQRLFFADPFSEGERGRWIKKQLLDDSNKLLKPNLNIRHIILMFFLNLVLPEILPSPNRTRRKEKEKMLKMKMLCYYYVCWCLLIVEFKVH